MTQPFESFGVQEMWFMQRQDAIDPTVGMPNNSGVYGYESKKYERPETLAPIEEDAGGFLFVPANVQPEFINHLVMLAGMGSTERSRCDQYGLQVIDAPVGREKELGYMRKLVIADRFALRFHFRLLDDRGYQDFEHQPLDVAGLIESFIEDEKKKYGTLFGNSNLAGKFGGDGYFAQESLGFGFAIENSYHHIISFWSRGWLCTK